MFGLRNALVSPINTHILYLVSLCWVVSSTLPVCCVYAVQNNLYICKISDKLDRWYKAETGCMSSARLCSNHRPAARIFHEGLPTSRTGTKFAMIGHASVKNRRPLGGPGGVLPRKQFETRKLLEMHWNCRSYHHRVILHHFKSLQFHQTDLSGSWGLRAHPSAYGSVTAKELEIGLISDSIY